MMRRKWRGAWGRKCGEKRGREAWFLRWQKNTQHCVRPRTNRFNIVQRCWIPHVNRVCQSCSMLLDIFYSTFLLLSFVNKIVEFVWQPCLTSNNKVVFNTVEWCRMRFKTFKWGRNFANEKHKEWEPTKFGCVGTGVEGYKKWDVWTPFPPSRNKFGVVFQFPLPRKSGSVGRSV